MKQLIAERGAAKAKLTMLKNFIDKITEEMDIVMIEKRVKANEAIYTRFDGIQTRIEELVVGTELEASHMQVRDSFETTFFSLMAHVERHIAQARASTETGTNASLVNTETSNKRQVPTIALSPFDGNYSDWL